MKKPNTDHNSKKETIQEYANRLNTYKAVTGKCPQCNAKLYAETGDCPNGH